MSGTASRPKKTAPYTRRYPRYPMDARMNVQVFRSGEISYFWGRSTELGLDGIGGTLTGDLEPGEVVTMEFPIPLHPFPLNVRAVVRFRIGLHYGFEFLTPTADQRASLERVCQMLAASAAT
jgi:hypothetical protein